MSSRDLEVPANGHSSTGRDTDAEHQPTGRAPNRFILGLFILFGILFTLAACWVGYLMFG